MIDRENIRFQRRMLVEHIRDAKRELRGYELDLENLQTMCLHPDETSGCANGRRWAYCQDCGRDS